MARRFLLGKTPQGDSYTPTSCVPSARTRGQVGVFCVGAMFDSRKAGIYLIVNRVTRAVYVGSAATSFNQRWKQHRSELRRGIHPNPYLQNAWNKYGEQNFVFEIAEIVNDRSRVLEREQEWLDACLGSDQIECYNLSPVAGSQLGYRHTEEARRKISAAGAGRKMKFSTIIARLRSRGIPSYRFRDPDGYVHEFDYLPDFCRKHGLSRIGMSHVWSGIQQHHQYWTRADANIVFPRYTFVAPDGIVYSGIIERKEFCRQHGLDDSNVLKVLRGKKATCRGWKIYEEQ